LWATFTAPLYGAGMMEYQVLKRFVLCAGADEDDSALPWEVSGVIVSKVAAAAGLRDIIIASSLSSTSE
jgi:hypothetical protein